MNRNFKCALLSAALLLTVHGAARADVLATWTFETSIPTTAGPHAAEAGLFAGSSFATGLHVSASAVYSNPVGNGSVESFSSNFWAIGDYYQFESNSIGYQDISISWNQTRSSTGPSTWDLFWSTDNSTYTLLLDNYLVPVVTWSSITPDVTLTTVFPSVLGPASLDNQATIYFRLVADSTASATAGSSRVDNIVIEGNAIPAPGALALLGIAGLVGSRRRR